jgi:hypothetical protein
MYRSLRYLRYDFLVLSASANTITTFVTALEEAAVLHSIVLDTITTITDVIILPQVHLQIL